jgi:hypothetical protein
MSKKSSIFFKAPKNALQFALLGVIIRKENEMGRAI